MGAVSYAAYQKYVQKPRPAAVPVPVPAAAPPAPTAAPGRSLSNIEKAKSILPFGFPGMQSTRERERIIQIKQDFLIDICNLSGPVNDLVYRSAYVASYNRRDRNPNWVAEHLTPESLKRTEGVDRGKSNFQEDPNIPVQFRAKLADYFKSNYDRGHMVPAADVKFDQEAMNETFYLTNISPQVGDGFNRDCKFLFFMHRKKNKYIHECIFRLGTC